MGRKLLGRAAAVTALLGAGFGAGVPGAAGAASLGGPAALQQSPESRIVTLRADGEPAQSASYDGVFDASGHFLVFVSADPLMVPGSPGRDDDAEIAPQVYLRDLSTGSTRLVSHAPDGGWGDGTSSEPDVSADGSRVVFTSNADNLVPDDTNGVSDVFLYDSATDAVRLISRNGAGSPGREYSRSPSISADGEHAVYETAGIAIGYDIASGVNYLVSHQYGHRDWRAEGTDPDLSADGNLIVFSSIDKVAQAPDPNGGAEDIYLYNRKTDTAVQITTTASWGHNRIPVISSDGTHIAWIRAPGLDYYDVYLYTVATGKTELVSGDIHGKPTTESLYNLTISADGYLVGFESFSSDLVHRDNNHKTDAFLYNAASKVTTLIARSNGVQANDGSGGPFIAGDGSRIGFGTAATNLDPRDTNDVSDLYVRVR